MEGENLMHNVDGELKNPFGEFLKGLFWISLLFLVFGVLASFPTHSAETLPIENFLTAPISKVEIEKDISVTFTYAPEKLDAGKTSGEFTKLSDLISIVKTPQYGNIDFLVKKCVNVPKSQTICLDLPSEKNETCKIPKIQTWIIQECKPFDFSSKVILEKGAIFQVVPDLTTAIYEKQPDGSSRYRVWEDLFIQGQKIEGATFWEGIQMTQYQVIAPLGDIDRVSDAYGMAQSFKATSDYRLCVIQFKEAVTSLNPPPSNMQVNVSNATANNLIFSNNTINYTRAGIFKNITFPNCLKMVSGASYWVNFSCSSIGVCGMKADGANPYADGWLRREDENWAASDANLQFWGFEPDLINPKIDACSPPNGSAFTLGVIQFRLNASDNSGLAALNHTDTFTGTTAYNFTPLNATPWYLNINFNTSGIYYWNAWANDTSGNTNTTGNCSLEILAATTTTTAPANATTTTVNLVVPGLGWFFAFFIVLVGFVVLGGLSK